MSRQRWIIFLSLGIITTIQAGAVSLFLLSRDSGTDSALIGLPLDDGWIHLVYARNMAEGLEIAYNPGEPEVGLTSPLWVLALSPFSTLPGHLPAIAAKCLSACFALLTCLLLAWLARDLFGDIAGLVAGLAAAIDPQLAFSAASGMEVCLSSSLLLATLLAIRKRSMLGAGLLLGLSWLARPESAALLVVIIPWCALLMKRSEIQWRKLAAGLACFMIAVVPFALYCLDVSGRPLTNTFYIKSSFELALGNGLHVLSWGVLSTSVVFGLGGGLLLALFGLRDLMQRKDTDQLAVAAAPIVLLLAILMSRPFAAEEAETYYYVRYFHPALALLMVWLGCGAQRLWTTGEGAPKPRRRGSKKRSRSKEKSSGSNLSRALLAATGLAIIVSTFLRIPEAAERFSWNTQNIEEMQVAAGRWIARETPDNAVIAASDAGAVRFFGDRRVIDMMGLNYHQGIEARRQGRIPMGQIMREEQPTHLAILPSWFPDIERGGRARPVFVGRAERYTVAATQEGEFVVYEVLRR